MRPGDRRVLSRLANDGILITPGKLDEVRRHIVSVFVKVRTGCTDGEAAAMTAGVDDKAVIDALDELMHGAAFGEPSDPADWIQTWLARAVEEGHDYVIVTRERREREIEPHYANHDDVIVTMDRLTLKGSHDLLYVLCRDYNDHWTKMSP